MTTEFVCADNQSLVKAGEIIRNGGLVAFPTETVYGLGGNALDPEAANKIFAAKGRPSDNPLIVHISSPELAEKYAYTNELYYKLAEAFMPGPLTIILPKKDCIPKSVTGGLDTVALRCPEHDIARELIKASGVPIAAPSANLSGSPSPTTAKHVYDDLNGRIDMIIDGGSSRIGVESTVIALTDIGCIVLRPGEIIPRELAEIVNEVQVSAAVLSPDLAGDKPQSPGMKYKHYAPKGDFSLIDSNDCKFIDFVNNQDGEVLVLSYSEHIDKINKSVIDIGKKDSPQELMHNLFHALRECDKRKCDKIFAMLPPQNDDFLALNNRLIRACGNNIIKL